MQPIIFALIKERKDPPDRRTVFSPTKLREVQELFPEAKFLVESSAIRAFPDVAYKNAEFTVSEDVTAAEVLIGVKEVPIDFLISGKKYFFFSHTIKKQEYNRELLQAVLFKNIELYDHEVITDQNGNRLIGFGRYAGLVGAYNGIRAWGERHKSWFLPPASTLSGLKAMKAKLDEINLPNIKICLTGGGRVAGGAKEILDYLKIRQVYVDDFLNMEFDEPVYCKIDVLDYNKRIDGEPATQKEFFRDPTTFESNFMRFAKVTQFLITGHFYGDGAPQFLTQEDARNPDFKIEVVADISCDLNGPIASTIRTSTLEDPFYGYDPKTQKETNFDAPGAITVMAVDNLPCALPMDASEGFGDMFLNHVMPAFFNDDKDGILERARMTKNGQLTDRFKYLQEFVEGKE
ncbi:NAD(P)-dependent oxidoreductase [Flavimarina sp. Hel_I_48]|uniref:NAD(P)-dependent oxidoreductase n=1 Tax=Flavimarina sp. Hel_I_48 TaxID=1392488 RepID=UPI0004DEF4B1|nr:NAD(P)-dependent oxidoreductase [Flavimarina sp. Hel_I_48]